MTISFFRGYDLYCRSIRCRFISGAVLALCLVSGSAARAEEPAPLRIAAAGSLRGALDDVAARFTRRTHIPTQITYGPAGQLNHRIQGGEAVDVFLSANAVYPELLAQARQAYMPFIFVKNSLCFKVLSQSGVTADTITAKLSDPAVHIGISTPGSDPAGDYGWQVLGNFERLENMAPGSVLYRARALTGGAVAPPVPQGMNPVVYFLKTGQVEAFITYCSRQHVQKQDEGITQFPVPSDIAVPVDYAGVTLIRTDRKPAADAFEKELRSPRAQAVFERYGFIGVKGGDAE
ncbi:hypothetical protein GOB93_06915 [Acetobacter musti]|uniref:Molybdate ABC transporter substrate-binding protein n=1 Tax=Acetobacter musti TaxID=864732 RepID=A0ABX0JMD1_9PROT|nr:substrate-binding domain-containing protein [Acetobacter musti]NHN84377.1 hypothetical protein [Acetobacter musti]